jgi:hypothetical protein
MFPVSNKFALWEGHNFLSSARAICLIGYRGCDFLVVKACDQPFFIWLEIEQLKKVTTQLPILTEQHG